jgi:hypothetical protein
MSECPTTTPLRHKARAWKKRKKDEKEYSVQQTNHPNSDHSRSHRASSRHREYCWPHVDKRAHQDA